MAALHLGSSAWNPGGGREQKTSRATSHVTVGCGPPGGLWVATAGEGMLDEMDL